MGHFKDINSNLKQYAKFQYDLFTKKTGITLNYGYEDLLNYIGNELDNYDEEYKKNGEGIPYENKVDEITAQIAPKVLSDSLANLNVKYSDDEFAKIAESFMDSINHIKMSFKVEKNLPYRLNPESVFCGITPNKYLDLYRNSTGKDANYYEEYNRKYSQVSKNHSATLVADLQEKTSRCKSFDMKALGETAAVYKRLKEKQKANSFFTNWFTSKGYKERAALKECEKNLKKIYGFETNSSYSTFEQKMNRYAMTPKSVISDFNKSYEDSLGKEDRSINGIYVDFVNYNQKKDKDSFIYDKLSECKKVIYKDGEVIDAKEANEELININNNEINTDSTQLDKSIDEIQK